jgi:Mg2+/citrate symporter
MFGWIKRAAMWVAGIAALLFAAWMAGKRDQRQQSAIDTAKSYAKTRKEIDDVESNTSDDPAVLRDWLRERGKQ